MPVIRQNRIMYLFKLAIVTPLVACLDYVLIFQSPDNC